MKKFSKIGKRVLAFFLVALMNINSYAAVGANDGSAFVTKAEFDALVNTFNEQMDSYADSLVSKVDGAIANYLASLSSFRIVEQDNIYNTIEKNADDGKVYWYGEFEPQNTLDVDKVEQIGEVLLVKMSDNIKTRVRIMSQNYPEYPGWATKVGSQANPIEGKFYYVSDNDGLKEYWTKVWIKHYFSGSASNSNQSGYSKGSAISMICNSKTFLQGFTKLGANTIEVAMGFDGGGYSAGNVTADVMQNLELTKEVTTKFKSGNMYSDIDASKMMLVIRDSDKDKVENYGTLTCKNALASHQYMTTSNTWTNGTITGRSRQGSGSTGDTMYCYKPLSYNIKVATLSSDPGTKVYEDKILVTEGLPLVKCTDDGTLKFDMTFVTSSGGTSDYIRYGFKKNTRFLNNKDDVVVESTLNTNIDTAVATNNKTVSVEIYNLKKNDEIWIKAFPLAANTYATCKIENLVLQTE